MRSPASIATFDHREFTRDALVEAKGDQLVSVCIPARDEQATVAGVVEVVHEALVAGLVDEIVVVDDGSEDETAARAEKAGAQVITCTDSSRTDGTARLGKGNAMAEGLRATSGDLVVFLDADVTNFAGHFLTGLLGPLLIHREICLVKGFYERPLAGDPTGGGRVTELVARPVISLLFPDLAEVRQPLAGETAGRRDVFRELSFEPGYGVEIGLLLDVAARYGVAAIAQVDLGRRVHRNRTLAELAPQAQEVLAAALDRAGVGAASSTRRSSEDE